MRRDHVIRCVLWTCRKTHLAPADAIAAGWGWFIPEWEDKIAWRCRKHLIGNEETENEPPRDEA